MGRLVAFGLGGVQQKFFEAVEHDSLPGHVVGADSRQFVIGRELAGQPVEQTPSERRGRFVVDRLGHRGSMRLEGAVVAAGGAGFRETLLAYYDACAALGARQHRAFARDLGVEPSYFADKFDRPMATLRLLRYPAASSARDEPIGAGAHTDYGNLTLLATDDVGGLKVRTRARG